jgi:hypothetical protein
LRASDEHKHPLDDLPARRDCWDRCCVGYNVEAKKLVYVWGDEQSGKSHLFCGGVISADVSGGHNGGGFIIENNHPIPIGRTSS